jgi:hypothetical protein
VRCIWLILFCILIAIKIDIFLNGQDLVCKNVEILLNVEKLTENIGFGIPIGQNVSFGGFHNFWYQNFRRHNRCFNKINILLIFSDFEKRKKKLVNFLCFFLILKTIIKQVFLIKNYLSALVSVLVLVSATMLSIPN